jgi:hypothetical protein
MFEILETENILAGKNRLTLLPPKSDLLPQLLAAQPGNGDGDSNRIQPLGKK